MNVYKLNESFPITEQDIKQMAFAALQISKNCTILNSWELIISF